MKDILIRASYKNQKRIIQTSRDKIFEIAAEKFGFKSDAVELYEVLENNSRKITVLELKDMMRISFVDANTGTKNMPFEGKLRSQLTNDGFASSSKDGTLVEGIKQKLLHNSTLTGAERKYLLEQLEMRFEKPQKNSTVLKAHKKVQAKPVMLKDSFAQTTKTGTDDSGDSKRKNSMNSREKLLKKRKVAGEEVDQEQISELMSDTYEERRTLIFAKNPPVALIKEKYPFLFSLQETKHELDRILYVGCCEDYLKNVELCAPIILEESKEASKDSKSPNPVYTLTKKSIENAKTPLQRKYAEQVGSILLLPGLFGEDIKFLKLRDNEIGNERETKDFPYIDAQLHTLDEIFTDEYIFRIYAEDVLLCEATNMCEAVLCLTACYFIFNIVYPEYNQRTLIAFEKLLLNANDTDNVDDFTEQMIKYLKIKVKERIL